MGVQTLLPELGVKRFNEGIISWFSGSIKIKRNVVGIGLKIKVTRDKFAAIVHTNCLWISNISADFF